MNDKRQHGSIYRFLARIKANLIFHFCDNLVYIFLNYFVAYIPAWFIRKFFYRLFGMSIGKKSRINQRVIIFNPKTIKIGNGCVINEYALLDGRSGLTIGNGNSISMYAKIYTGTHKSYSNTFEYLGKPTLIKDNCWIGTSAVIMPGSELADFTIISVNSVFKGKSTEKGIYMGIPAVKIKDREITNKYLCYENSWWK